MANHRLSTITTGMVKPPLNPHTGVVSTLHDLDRLLSKSSMQELYNEDSYAVDQPEPKGFGPASKLERDPGLSPFYIDRDQLISELYTKLKDLKRERLKRKNIIELLHANADARCYQAKTFPNRSPLDGSCRRGVFLTEEGSLGMGQERESFVREGVKQVWDDFNLKDYLTPAAIEKIDQAKEKRLLVKSATGKKTEWSPVITIPKPFSMTLKEEKKKEQSRIRSVQEVAQAEQERMKQKKYEAETRVRPRDPPPHTSLPLFEEIVQRQQERSRMNRENASRALETMVKPFSFMERERLIQEQKVKDLERKKEMKKLKSTIQFAAEPHIARINDPTIAEGLKGKHKDTKFRVKDHDYGQCPLSALTDDARLGIEETRRAIAKAENELLEMKLKAMQDGKPQEWSTPCGGMEDCEMSDEG